MGSGTCGRGLGAARRNKGQGARALPEIGSEILGTEGEMRPHTGPLSTSSSSSRGKGEAGDGPGRGRGRATEDGIFATSWPPGCGAPCSLLKPRRHQLRPHSALLGAAGLAAAG